MNLKGKKILVLGANAETIPIVLKAQKMGVYVIVTDYIINSPAKLIADEYYDIDGKDIELIVDVIKKREVDGVMIGVADPLISSYVEICERMRFPCLLSKTAIDFFSNKSLFKNTCIRYKLPVIKELFSCSEFGQINKNNISYPIVVKPAKCRGGRAISYCEGKVELKKAFTIARKNSDNDEVIGEEYITAEDAVATFLLVNGKTYFLTMSDRIMFKDNNVLSTVTYSNIFPSLNIQIFKDKYMDKYVKLFKDLKIINGIVNIQMFYKNGQFIPYDSDCILNGECSSDLFKVILGIDIIENFIKYSLSGEFDDINCEDIQASNHMCIGASIWIILKPGIIGKIQGREEVLKKKYIIDYVWRMEEGGEVTEEMRYTEKSTLARIWIKANNREEIVDRTAEIRNQIKVFDVYGKEMVEKWIM